MRRSCRPRRKRGAGERCRFLKKAPRNPRTQKTLHKSRNTVHAEAKEIGVAGKETSALVGVPRGERSEPWGFPWDGSFPACAPQRAFPRMRGNRGTSSPGKDTYPMDARPTLVPTMLRGTSCRPRVGTPGNEGRCRFLKKAPRNPHAKTFAQKQEHRSCGDKAERRLRAPTKKTALRLFFYSAKNAFGKRAARARSSSLPGTRTPAHGNARPSASYFPAHRSW